MKIMYDELIRIGCRFMELILSVGKCVCLSYDWFVFFFCFLLV